MFQGQLLTLTVPIEPPPPREPSPIPLTLSKDGNASSVPPAPVSAEASSTVTRDVEKSLQLSAQNSADPANTDLRAPQPLSQAADSISLCQLAQQSASQGAAVVSVTLPTPPASEPNDNTRPRSPSSSLPKPEPEKNVMVSPEVKVPTQKEIEAEARAKERAAKAAILKERQDRMALQPFVADAIISNPTTYTHVHLAQALHVPLHMFFTMPWSRTDAFPHPLSNFAYGQVERKEAESLWVCEVQKQLVEDKKDAASISSTRFSYDMIDRLMWFSTSDYINEFRTQHGLGTLGQSDGPYLVNSLKVPFGYIWSPALIPKPHDWGAHIDVLGFSVLPGSGFTGEPPADIAAWISQGTPPIYVGFGSCVLEDPVGLADAIVAAARAVGVRVIMQLGWSKLGEHHKATDPANVLVINAVPHDWLFKLTAAVVHHGGAGTTCAGLLAANPTLVVPFFGDQPFWGAMISNAGAGPRPVPPDKATLATLTAAFQFLLLPETKLAATEMGAKMKHEDGISEAVKAFSKRCNPHNLRCDVLPNEVAKVQPQLRLKP
jgi:hypothetical protein